jgi:hypothetical protein
MGRTKFSNAVRALKKNTDSLTRIAHAGPGRTSLTVQSELVRDNLQHYSIDTPGCGGFLRSAEESTND